MTTERIKEIQQATAHPDSISVQQALLQVWNECEQERKLADYIEKLKWRYELKYRTISNDTHEYFFNDTHHEQNSRVLTVTGEKDIEGAWEIFAKSKMGDSAPIIKVVHLVLFGQPERVVAAFFNKEAANRYVDGDDRCKIKTIEII